MRISPSIVLLRTQSDERLVALAAEGSEPAFTALVERYRRTVLRACMRVLPEARAEDATQQVFVSAWTALTRGDDVQYVRAWLQRIARNTALNQLRTPGYEYDELAESLEGGSAPPAELERRDVMRQTLAGLAALPDNQREALLRSAVQGASHADIARDLGLSEGATRQLVLRARATLRSAASALTPLPLINWAASGSAVPLAEAAAGGSVAGSSLLLAKVGAVAVLAGGAVATPAIVHRAGKDKPHSARAAERAPKRAERPSRPRAEAAVVVTAAPAEDTSRRRRTGDDRRERRRGRERDTDRGGSSSGHGSGGDDSSGSGSSGSSGSGSGGSGDSSESSGSGSSGSSGSGNSGSGHGGSGSHGSGNSGSGNSGSGHGGSGDHGSGNSGSGNSGSGHGSSDEAEPTVTAPPVVATATPAAEDDPSGHGGNSGHGGGDDDEDED